MSSTPKSQRGPLCAECGRVGNAACIHGTVTPSGPPNAARGDDWRQRSVVEIAAENQSVREYCAHWETRAVFAEGEIAVAHRVLDERGAPRVNREGVAYSLGGRLWADLEYAPQDHKGRCASGAIPGENMSNTPDKDSSPLTPTRIYRRAVETWGPDAQWGMVQEECAELIAAVSKYWRGRIGLAELASEVADVEIMCAQAREIVGDLRVDTAKDAKLRRLAQRLETVKP